MSDFKEITLFKARAIGLEFDEPEITRCEFCGAELDRIGVSIKGRISWANTKCCDCPGSIEAKRASEALALENQRAEEAERRRKAIASSGIPRRYSAAIVAGPDLFDYIASFEGNGGAGLYIYGGIGRGKTYSAAALALAFLDADYNVKFSTAKNMLESIKKTFDAKGSTDAEIRKFSKCDLLFLDDLGKEEASEWSVGMIFAVIDQRYEDMRPTIITSNYSLDELEKRLGRRGEKVSAEAIISRIRQTCRVIKLAGPDKRLIEKV